MGEAVDRLMGYMPDSSRHDLDYREGRRLQIAGMNERRHEQGERIKLVTMRAADAGIAEIGSGEDAACGRAGHHVSCSSGTTGRSAMLVASQADLDFASQDGVQAVQWGSDIREGDMRTTAGAAGAVAYTPRNAAMGMRMMQAFSDPAAPRFESGVPPEGGRSGVTAPKMRVSGPR